MATPDSSKISHSVTSTGKRKAGKPGALAAGIGFTMILAALGLGLAHLPIFNRAGQLACSILLAIAYRQLWGYPESIRRGIQFSAQKLLRFAIILFGLKLNIGVVLQEGLPLLVRDAATVVFAILATLLIGKWLKADFSLSLLLGIGTGVCGAAAIAAVSPILKAKEDDTAIGAGIVALVGTLFAVSYTVLRPLLPLTDLQYGIWSGVSLHEIAHVALAAEPAGPDALAVALLAKLGRVFLLVPLSFALMIAMKRARQAVARAGADRDHAAESAPGSHIKVPFPWFLLGFIATSVLGSYVLGSLITVPAAALNGLSSLTAFLLTMAMVGLGLNVSFRDLRSKALRPFLAMLITSVLLSGLTWLSLTA
ncbi:YeiH family protein [Paenibacillus macerans]|uniref:YeiH family protein n=1 Tax=Paenibacillus macerans TaxID=44252 RepID=UPI003D31EF76